MVNFISMKMSTQCAPVSKMENLLLTIIRRGIENRIASVIRYLYKSMRRSPLEYYVLPLVTVAGKCTEKKRQPK